MKKPTLPLKSSLLALVGVSCLGFASASSAAEAKKLLVISTTAGFRHGGAIEASKKVFPQLQEESDGTLVFEFVTDPGQMPEAGSKPERKEGTTDEEWAKIQEERAAFEEKIKEDRKAWLANAKQLLDEKVNDDYLAGFDGVVFNNTTGDELPVDVDAVSRFVKSGKAFIGIHAATDTLKHNDAYMEIVNGGFAGHPWNAEYTQGFTNHDPRHVTVAMFKDAFQWTDEIYQFNKFDPKAVRVLISLDMANSSPKVPYHVPVAWVRELGDGRVFYTSLGHNPSTLENKTFQEHLVAGIRWAMKETEGSAEPNPEVSAQETIKAIAATAGEVLNEDAAALESKGLSKAESDREWALDLYAKAGEYRSLPNPDPKKEPAEKVAEADKKKRELLESLVGEIKN